MSHHRLLTINGETRTVSAWAKVGAVDNHTILRRLFRGWTDDEAVFLPLGSKPANPWIAKPRRLKASPHRPNPHRPCIGGFRSWPIEALPLLRRVA